MLQCKCAKHDRNRIFQEHQINFFKGKYKDTDTVDNIEKLVGVCFVDAICAAKEKTKKVLQKETLMQAFGKPISEDEIECNKATVVFTNTNIFDALFEGPNRNYARFYTLENVTNMLHFSYLSALHLCETLDMWMQKTCLKTHFSE